MIFMALFGFRRPNVTKKRNADDEAVLPVFSSCAFDEVHGNSYKLSQACRA